MGLFSDIISGIGNGISDIFGGGGNNDQKRRQQQQQQQQAPAPVSPPIGGFNRSPVQLPAVFQAAQQQQQNNPLHLFTPNQQPQNPLQAPQPGAPQINAQNYAQPQDHQSLWSHLLHGAENVGEGVAGVGAGAALGTLRAGEGLVQGVAQIPQMAIHLGAKGGELLSGDPNAGQGIDQAATDITNKITSPIDWLANKTDQATGMFNHEDGTPTITGKIVHDIYTPAQVAANIATVVPAVTAAAPRVAALLGDSGKAGDFLNGVNDFVKGQSEIPNLTKVPVLGSILDHVPGVGGGKPEVADEAATADKTPVESGVKSPAEPANAPAGDKNAPPEKAPGATETGIKPAPEPVEEPGVTPQLAAGAPAAEPVTAPTGLEKTGNDVQDLHNATDLVKSILTNGRDYSGASGKNVLQQVLDQANAHLHSNDIISSAINKRFGSALTDQEAANVRNAIETGKTTGLSDKEASVVKSLQENIQAPSNTTRTALNKDYQEAQNHFPQVRQTGAVKDIKEAAAGASQGKGVNGKISTFQDLLNRNSRFSEGSTLGTFTRGGKSITGDANDLGLVPKTDGTFVDKAGNKYTYSRATSQDLENAGAKIRSPKDALTAYVRDTLNLKTRADAADYLIKNADTLGLHDAPAPGAESPVHLPAAKGETKTFFTDAKTAKDIQSSGISSGGTNTGLLKKGWNALSNLVAQATVVNPFAHGLNLATNAAVGAGERANGIGGIQTLMRGLKPIDEATELRMSDAGVHFPTYGKNTVTAISKLTHGASKLNEAAVSVIDRQARSGMFDSLTKGGMSDKEAAATINKWMGGRGTYNSNDANLGIFWNYFTRQVKNGGELLKQAAQGHPGPLINAAIAGGATYAADQGLKSATGNQNAYIHVPGVVGIANDAYNTGKDLVTGQYRQAINPLTSHVNPVLSTAAEQALGVDQYGNKFSDSANPGQARLDNILQTTPETNLLNDNGHSAAEKGLNTFGIYTPHIKGDMATNNPALSFLNVKNAQNGSSVAFPKDFTGEQTSKAVNDFVSATGGKDYTYKNAATIASQTPEQRQAFTTNTKALETAGVSSQNAPTYAKDMMRMSKDDQQAYLQAIHSINTSTDGTTLSSASIEKELVKNGKTELAASLNKNIPDSLPTADKIALETHDTFATDGQKKVWLQDNNNASAYYDALIRQKQAQGGLTTDDTDVGAAWSGSGGSLYVNDLVAQTNKQNNVPQSLVELYKNTSKTEYNKMSGAEKDQLTTYANQLNANGVIDKFGLATGTSGGSGGSSGGKTPSQMDVAAGIPFGALSGQFVKPTTDPGLKSTSPLAFKGPKLVKYTPDAKANPFVRSISVSSGVK